jgi:CBS domain-containing protein
MRNQILGAPVADEATGGYHGFVDVLDVLAFVAEELSSSYSTGKLDEFVRDNTRMDSESVLTVIDKSNRDKFTILPAQSTVRQALQKLVEGKLHRIAVAGEDKKLCLVLTDFALVHRLYADKDTVCSGSILQSSIGQLQLGSAKAVTIGKSKSTLDAFMEMNRHHISGIGIVDDATGYLIGNVSARDLRHALTGLMAEELKLPIHSFISRIRRADVEHDNPSVSVTENAAFDLAFGRLVATRLHRLYVITPEGLPRQVISILDVLSCIHKHVPAHRN